MVSKMKEQVAKDNGEVVEWDPKCVDSQEEKKWRPRMNFLVVRWILDVSGWL